MDALSEALNALRMGLPVPQLQAVAHVLAPGTERLVSYHLVTEGQALVRFAASDIPVAAGDVLTIRINLRGDATGELGAPSGVRGRVRASGPIGPALKMAEALSIETLRRYMEQLPPEQIGWLAGAGPGGRRRAGLAAPQALAPLDPKGTRCRGRSVSLGAGRPL